MTTLRKLARTQKRLKTLAIILHILPLLLAIPFFIVGIINMPSPMTLIHGIILSVWAIGMFLIYLKLEAVKKDIAYEIESTLYSAFREIFNDDVFEDELFGFVECDEQGIENISVNVDIFTDTIDYKELVSAIEPTVDMLKRALRKNVKLYYVISTYNKQ